jgi:hypothetical protein
VQNPGEIQFCPQKTPKMGVKCPKMPGKKPTKSRDKMLVQDLHQKIGQFAKNGEIGRKQPKKS